MKKQVLMIAMTLAVSAITWAKGPGEGGGGVGFLCGSKVLMADETDAQKNGDVLDLGPDQLNYQEKVEWVLNKLAKVAPARAEKYKEIRKKMTIKMSSLGDRLDNASDFVNLEIPAGCSPVQVAFQNDPRLIALGEPRLVIASGIFNLMSESSKAVLLLHEIVYADIIDASKIEGTHDNHSGNGATVRFIVRKIFSKGFNKSLYNQMMSAGLFPTFEFFGKLFVYLGHDGTFVKTDGLCSPEIIAAAKEYKIGKYTWGGPYNATCELILKKSDDGSTFEFSASSIIY